MSTAVKLPEDLEEIPCPHVEPRLAYMAYEPRKANNLTLIDGKTFLSTTVAGDITPPGAPDVGFFHDDTRFLSRLELRVSGHRTVVLSSSQERNFAAKIELTTGAMAQINSIDLPENTLHVRRQQLLYLDVFHDLLVFANFNQSAIEILVEMDYEADFVDVFQVRGAARNRCGRYFRPIAERDSILFHYLGLDGVARKTLVHFGNPPDGIDGTTAHWRLRIPAGERIELLAQVRCFVDGKARAADESFSHGVQVRREGYAEWEKESTRFESGNEVFDIALSNCIGDFHALQIPDGNDHAIAAGIPWFATIFGRDSIIAGYQSLLLNPRLAKETLRVLARYQGKEVNDWRDEEPGKIVHEMRSGEMARDDEVPFGAYYGSVDATPLFLILLSETFNWTADSAFVEEMLPSARAALEWIEKYGDLDGDGLIEYKRRSPRGLTNQGWKDSWDANRHRNGEMAEPPIALVEVQGYCYEAMYRMSQLLRQFGEIDHADDLRRRSSELAKKIDKAFWMSQENYYAMALDAHKHKVEVVSSNPGHLLFARAVTRDRARAIVDRVMKEDMNSGWGIRTVSRSESTFNPLSYHRGSLWPHDNSLIAYGMSLYGFREEVNQIFTSLFQAAQHIRDYRLPELFCGMQRREYDSPVAYPVSCSPQAWASGTFFLLLGAVLGLRPSAARKELNIVNPVLPTFLDHLRIENLQVGQSRASLEFTRRGDRTFCNVIGVEGEKLLINVAFRK